ncbi:MAG: hypothetical protein ACFFB8_17980, partial [Promethearchaeota archaeon]
YQKIILKDNKLKGAILFGETKANSYINKKMEQDVDRDELRKLLELYVYKCENCGKEYDEIKMDILFKDLPDDFKCDCGASKNKFKRKE